ncbi:hypothetical protein PPSIR1_08476, partial [Plesiocystis pacifica SIR-1]
MKAARAGVALATLALVAGASLLIGDGGAIGGDQAQAQGQIGGRSRHRAGIQTRDRTMPEPARRRRAAARLDRNAECVHCHAEIAAEWQGSLHAQAYTDPLFQVSFERENFSDFCQGCHAPEASPRGDVEADRGAVGVACVSCHVVGDEAEGPVLAGPRPDWEVDRPERSPHALNRDPRFATAAACAGCHEFDFPNARRAGNTLKMQRTVTEHRRSKASEHSCQSCHMT